MKKSKAKVAPKVAPGTAPKRPPDLPPRGLSFEDRPDRPQPFRVRWREPGGKKRSRSFDSQAKRLAFARDWENRKVTFGRAATVVSPRQVEVWKLFANLTGGRDPLEVARWWVKHSPTVGGQMTVAEAIGKYRKTARLSGHASLHLDRLQAALGARRLGDLEAEHLAGWLDGLTEPRTGEPMAAWTRIHHFRSAKRFFEACLSERWADRNPMTTLRQPAREEDDVFVISPQECRKLFEVAAGSIAVGRLALEAFGGLRYTSAARMAKGDIDRDARGIVMPGRKHKSGRRHYVEGFPENLWAWLAVTPKQCWSLTERQYFEEKGRIFREAGLKPEGKARTRQDKERLARMHNVLRHSFASYHVALTGDAARTAILLTHRNQAMLWQHYRGRATKADAEAYFAITPVSAPRPVRRPELPRIASEAVVGPPSRSATSGG